MAGVYNEDVDIAEKSDNQPAERRQEIGLMSRIWNGLFGSQDDDFGRRLERISKEEASILSRIRRRSHSSGRIRLHLILFSVVLEFIAVGYAILTATSVENWKNRAFHVLPMFLLPVVSSVTYTALANFIKMCERKDQKTLEDLRAEKQSKIDELKEKTNYYITQQLIQKYDTDPAAKAAAATVLASKLGADSGLKVYLGDDSHHHPTTGKSNDAESIQSDGLRRRKQPQPRSRSAGSSPVTLSPDPALLQQIGDEIAEHDQPVYVDHYQQEQGSDPYTGNWLARIAALLVGEDPTQSYALICGNCHIHNGLATKEDFPYLTYICPHCRAVNGPRKKDSRISVSSSPRAASLLTEDNDKTVSNVNGSPTEGTLESNDNEQRPLSLTTEGIDDEDKNGQAPTSEDKES